MTAPLERTVNPQDLDPATVRLLPYAFAKAKGAIAARQAGATLEVWFRGTPQAATLAEVRRMAGKHLKEVLLTPEEFEHCLALAYTREPNAAETIVEDMGESLDLARLTESLPEVADLLEAENDAPIIRLINALLTQAVREGASDVHLEIFESRALVRYRVDGALRDVVEPRRGLHPAMVSRIKVMASLDIAEKRLPQDGRIALRVAGRPIDVRVSTIPTANGERVVLRLLDKQAGRLTLDALGMGAATRDAIDAVIQQPHGIFLVTGPTGSGKTTTLYAALTRLDRKTRNILTVEDPVEYELDGIGQTPVNPKIDMTFARALRAILRQDPDVVMIGEIRDLETAQIAVQASLTGHLVLATLHTNDAPGAVTRLADMGIEPYLLASTLSGVLAQRLVRKLCAACKSPYEPDAAERAVFREDAPQRLYRATGCAACNFTGYKGRTGIYELLTVDEDLRRLVHDTAAERDIRDKALAKGMVRLREDGLRWVRDGATSLDEVLRVTRETMPGFRYQAYSIEGQLRKGVLEADSARQARSLLRDQGLTPYKVEVIAANDPAGGSRFRALSLSSADLTRLTRSLASLLEAGLTVEQAFNALIEQAEAERERQVLAALRGEVMAGSTIAKALEAFPGVFPELYRTLVAAGEASGQLPRVMARLADYLEERHALRAKLALALVYPAIVMGVSLLVMGALLVYVVPQVVQVYSHAKEALPLLTRALIAVSAFLQLTWPAWIVLAVGAGVGFRLALARPGPRAAIHRAALRTPIIGKALRQLDSTRLAATLSILVGSRVPILAALEAGEGVMTLVPMREALATAARGVREGMALSRALGATDAFPPVMVHLIAGGEATGRLDEALERAARQQQADLSTRLAAAVAVFEPALIVAMGVLVLAIVLAILMPIFNLNQLVGR